MDSEQNGKLKKHHTKQRSFTIVFVGSYGTNAKEPGIGVGVMKCKSTGSLVATFLGTDNLRHPYNSIVYCGSSFPYSIQIVNDMSTRSYISIYTGGYPRIKAMQYKRQV